MKLIRAGLGHARARAGLLSIVAALSLGGGCTSAPGQTSSQLTPSTHVNMTFTRSASFFSAPVPSDDLRKADGTIDVSQWPHPDGIDVGTQVLSLIASGTNGFGQSAGIFFTTSAPLDATKLPTLAGSIAPSAAIFVMGIDDPGVGGPSDVGVRKPVFINFETDPGPFGAPNMLSLIPLQGIVFHPKSTYAAVVRRSLGATDGQPLEVTDEMKALLVGQKPAGMPDAAFATYAKAISTLKTQGVLLDDIAGLAVFTTGDATAPFDVVAADILSQSRPTPKSAFTKTDTFDGYCVYQTVVSMPDYQSGTPPFNSSGGGWVFDASGKPIVQRHEDARIVVTVPRTPMPAGGWPTTMLVRTGAGGDRPLVDRGTQATNGGPPITPGTGPARWFAMAGFAGVQIDGPHGGPYRNPTGADEQFLMFNVNNLTALRDNVRESAVELVLFAHMLPDLSFDTSDCAGTSPKASFDTSKLALFGHSMGASIAPLVMAKEPMFGAVILSGSGGSWIENVMHKHHPAEVAPLIELLLGYTGIRNISAHDPVLSLFQWAEESCDSQIYGAAIVQAPMKGAKPKHVMMFQGIVDHYIMPQIANTTTLSVGIDAGGPLLDATNAELQADGELTLAAVLPYSKRGNIAFPISGNVKTSGGAVTAVVTQHLADGIEDGHEVAFQTEVPKHEYRCFLESWRKTGTPSVPPDGHADDPCP